MRLPRHVDFTFTLSSTTFSICFSVFLNLLTQTMKMIINDMINNEVNREVRMRAVTLKAGDTLTCRFIDTVTRFDTSLVCPAELWARIPNTYRTAPTKYKYFIEYFSNILFCITLLCLFYFR